MVFFLKDEFIIRVDYFVHYVCSLLLPSIIEDDNLGTILANLADDVIPGQQTGLKPFPGGYRKIGRYRAVGPESEYLAGGDHILNIRQIAFNHLQGFFITKAFIPHGRADQKAFFQVSMMENKKSCHQDDRKDQKRRLENAGPFPHWNQHHLAQGVSRQYGSRRGYKQPVMGPDRSVII